MNYDEKQQKLFQIFARPFVMRVCVLSCFSHVLFFSTLWTVAHQAPMPMRFSRQEYWSGLPCPPPGCLPHPGIEALSPLASAMQADSFLLSYQRSPRPFVTENKSDSISYLFCFFFLTLTFIFYCFCFELIMLHIA